jgi:hypothetical protein
LCCDADAVHEVSVERCGLVLGFCDNFNYP